MYMKKIKQKYIWVVDAMLHVHVKFKLNIFFARRNKKDKINMQPMRVADPYEQCIQLNGILALSFLFLLVQNLVQAHAGYY